MKIGILNYNACNLSSVYNSVYNLGYDPIIINNVGDLKIIKKLIIPGVGSARHCISFLNEKNFFTEILNLKKLGMPILGICLGMQIFSSKLYEHGENNGLGFFEAKVIPLKYEKKFNIGWKTVQAYKNKNYNFINLVNNKTFYFCHSYYLKPAIGQKKNITAKILLKDEIPVIINKDNIIGVQFHPEKSQTNGLNFLKYFIEDFK